MQDKMKKVGFGMAVSMGVVMSFFLSLVGMLSSGHFTFIGFIISFAVSTVVSMLIGFIVPMGKVSDMACRSLKLEPGTMPNRLLSSLISNTIYTPIMTLIMVFLARFRIMKDSGGRAEVPFGPMFLKSFIITYIVGYVLVFIFMPLFMKFFFKKFDIPMGNQKKIPPIDHKDPGSREDK